MLLFMDGFDQLRDTPAENMLATLNASGYTAVGAVTVAAARDTTQRCLQIGDGGSAVASLKRIFSSAANKVIIGFAYRASATRTNIVEIKNVGTLAWNPDTGKLGFAGGTGTATILLDLWYYFEIVVDKAGELVQVYVNNGKDIEAGIPDSAKFLTQYETTWTNSATDFKCVDDLVLVDAGTGRYTDRVGPISILTRLPTSDVDKEWTPSSGNDHYALVDNQPPRDDEFIQSNTSGATDTFLANAGLPANAQIIAVGLTVRNKKSDIDARQLGMVMGRKGQTQKEVVDTNLSTTPKYSYAVFESSPDGAAWNDVSTTSTPFGVVVRP